jgi:hypothetical protein
MLLASTCTSLRARGDVYERVAKTRQMSVTSSKYGWYNLHLAGLGESLVGNNALNSRFGGAARVSEGESSAQPSKQQSDFTNLGTVQIGWRGAAGMVASNLDC